MTQPTVMKPGVYVLAVTFLASPRGEQIVMGELMLKASILKQQNCEHQISVPFCTQYLVAINGITLRGYYQATNQEKQQQLQVRDKSVSFCGFLTIEHVLYKDKYS